MNKTDTYCKIINVLKAKSVTFQIASLLNISGSKEPNAKRKLLGSGEQKLNSVVTLVLMWLPGKKRQSPYISRIYTVIIVFRQ